MKKQAYDQHYIDDMRTRTEEETARRLSGGRRVIEPKPLPAYKDTLLFIVSREPFEWLKSGEKTAEFRDYNSYFVDKCLGCGKNHYKTVTFQWGYVNEGRPPPPRMVFEFKGVYLYDGCDEYPAFRRDGSLTLEKHLPEDFYPDQLTIHIGKRIS